MGQSGEVLMSKADDVSHPEDGAVGVVDRVKVARFDVFAGDGGQEVTPGVGDGGGERRAL